MRYKAGLWTGRTTLPEDLRSQTITLAFINPNLPIAGNVLIIAILILSLGIHEAAHGWVALKRGDTTARDLGRITLNPIAHIDPFMTIILPAILLMTTGFIFGGARPVPVNFHRLKHPLRDMALVALAGPVSNFLIALVLAFALALTRRFAGWDEGTLGHEVLLGGVLLNLLLAAFNLIPIPPLDGSRIMAWLLPENLREPYVRLENMGLMIVMLLIFTGVLSGPLRSMMSLLWNVIQFIVSFGGAW